ncbi:uncharacterized protein BJ212DRAFT_1590997 [Suillus subaureus]|uniref:Uncharacterized protein n=1 Tax=Suillus subaureus TaxID=48587 RepID=A0A9P7DVW8_9AGAM|nr:uncharacterized protein BJ212DRAFT_1590997 [Suillus subaureus]KAG1804412.1 hypothetical protein BJ212DRAFT_1590997 [Suillus subaureus]
MTIPKKITNKGTGMLTESTLPSAMIATTHQTRRSNLSQEDIEVLPSTIKNIENAEEYLNKNLLCHVDEPFTLTHLISVLFHITQLKSIPLPAVEAIRVVVYIMKKHEANEIAENITNQITNNLSPRIAEHVIVAIALHVAKILSTLEGLDNMLKEAERLKTMLEREKEEKRDDMATVAEHFKEVADTLHKSMNNCSKTLKSFKPNLIKAQECINELSQQLTSNPNTSQTTNMPSTTQQQQQQQQQPSYSSITTANLPPSIDKAVARAAL